MNNMPSKWQNLRGTLEPFKQEEGWQQQIDLVKKEHVGLSKLELCSELVDEDHEKKRLEEALQACNTRREALNQLILDKLEAEGDEKITNGMGTFYISDSPYSAVRDKERYLKWIREQGLEALLSVPYPTTNAQVKARLEAGQPLPPGVDVFIKSQIRRRA